MKTTIGPFRSLTLVALTVAGLLTFSASLALAQKENSTVPKDDNSVYAELAKVPEKARAKQNPFGGYSEAIAAGGKLFAQHCAECHEKKAEGGKRGPSLLREKVQQATPGALFWILTNGVAWRGMPVWSKLPEPERWQIVTFLKSLTTSAGRKPPTGPE